MTGKVIIGLIMLVIITAGLFIARRLIKNKRNK